MFSSILQVLKVEEQVSKTTDPKTGQPYVRHFARCVLVNDDGTVNNVGRLRIPRDLVEQVKVGTFHAGFALDVPDYGDNKGDIVAKLTSLVAAPVKSAPTPKAA